MFPALGFMNLGKTRQSSGTLTDGPGDVPVVYILDHVCQSRIIIVCFINGVWVVILSRIKVLDAIIPVESLH